MGVEITGNGSLQKTPKGFKEFLSNDDLIDKEWQSDKYESKICESQVLFSTR